MLAVAIQLAPLAAPLLLSSDAWTYWMYGRIAAVHEESPYDQPPEAFLDDPALPRTAPAWRDQTSLYGPAFTLASEPVALAAGESEDAAAWLFKALAGAAMLPAALLAARLAVRKELRAGARRGGTRCSPCMRRRRPQRRVARSARPRRAGPRRLGAAAPGGRAWALAVLVKWGPARLLVLRALEARAAAVGAARTSASPASSSPWPAVATLRGGLSWLGAFGPLAENVDQATSYALPERLGLPGWVRIAAFAVAFAWLARPGLARPGTGRPRGGAAARDDAVPDALVPGVDSPARRRGGGSRGPRARGAPHRLPRTTDDPDLGRRRRLHGRRRWRLRRWGRLGHGR